MGEKSAQPVTGRTRLAELQRNLRRLNRNWKGENHDALIALFVRLLPGTLDAERAAVFVVEKGSQRIVSRTGTDQHAGFTTRSALCVPVLGTEDQAVIGAVEVLNKCSGGRFVAADRELLEGVADLLARAIENVVISQEIGQVSQQIERELGRRMRGVDDEFIGDSPPMGELVERARVVSELPVNALLLGENGTSLRPLAASAALKSAPPYPSASRPSSVS